jgi:hypothetical protein
MIQDNRRGAQNFESVFLQSQAKIHIHIVNEKGVIIKGFQNSSSP